MAITFVSVLIFDVMALNNKIFLTFKKWFIFGWQWKCCWLSHQVEINVIYCYFDYYCVNPWNENICRREKYSIWQKCRFFQWLIRFFSCVKLFIQKKQNKKQKKIFWIENHWIDFKVFRGIFIEVFISVNEFCFPLCHICCLHPLSLHVDCFFA